VRDPDNPGVHLVRRALLREVSLTAMPAFDDARVTSLAASADHPQGDPVSDTDAATAPAPVPGGFDLNAFAAAYATLQNGNPLGVHQTQPEVRPVVNPTATATFVNEPAPYRFDARGGMQRGGNGYDFSSDIINAGKGDAEAKARVERFISEQFDTDRADVAALNPNVQRPDMYVDQLDYATPLWDMVNRGTLADSTPFVVPKFNTSSGLVGPHTEGVEPTAGSLTATSQTITPTAVSGKAEITREAWDQGGNPQLSTIIWRQMLREYYEERESAVATFLNTLTAATDITLTAGESDADLANELEAAIAALQFVRGGNRFRAFAVHVDLYKALAAAEDSTGRKIYPMIGATNANGTASPLFAALNVAGTVAVPSWALGASGTAAANSWLFDPSVVHGWASAPQKLQFEYQVKQIEVAIWGYTALANTRIEGVRQVIYDPVA
jgi:hypothetical protein